MSLLLIAPLTPHFVEAQNAGVYIWVLVRFILDTPLSSQGSSAFICFIYCLFIKSHLMEGSTKNEKDFKK